MPRPSQTRDARAKSAKYFINQTVPAVLRSNPRARKGVDSVELFYDLPAVPNLSATHVAGSKSSSFRDGGKRDRSRKDSFTKGHRTQGHEEETSGRESKELGISIALRVRDTLAAASTLSQIMATDGRRRGHVARVAILNMASPLRPGGGVLTGASSQEEHLCSCTTLYPSLQEKFYRLPDIGGVYTSDVLVLRNPRANRFDEETLSVTDDVTEEGMSNDQDQAKKESSSAPEEGDDDEEGEGEEKADESGEDPSKLLPPPSRFFIDVITSAAPRFPDVDVNEQTGERQYSEDKDRELMRSKMKAVLRMARRKGVDGLVLGAWGCGAYGNPIGEVARLWRRVLLGKPTKEQQQPKTKTKTSIEHDAKGSGGSSGGSSRGRDGVQAELSLGPGAEAWPGLHVIFAVYDLKTAYLFLDAFGSDLSFDDMEQYPPSQRTLPNMDELRAVRHEERMNS